MKKGVLLILTILTIILIGVGLQGYYIYRTKIKLDTIYPGIEVGEFNVGGMKKEEALDYIKKEKTREISQKSMELKYKDKIYPLNLTDIEYGYNYQEVIDQAYNLGREGNIFQRYRKIKNLEEEGELLTLQEDYSLARIKDIVLEITKDLYIESRDAEFNFNKGNIIIKDEIVGQEVDKLGLEKLIEGNLDELEDINIPVNTIKPKYTKDYYSQINGIISKFSTSFQNSSLGRKENIRLSAEKFNGVLLHSGETFSFNKIIGPIERETGYQEAPVIIDGEFTPGIGGGVCQTSTTLYNAALLADLTIVERHPHSIPPDYIEEGRDAAIAGDYLDLKFKNDYDYPIYIGSKLANNRVYFYIWGKKD